MPNILAENIQSNIHHIKILLNRHLGCRQGGFVSSSSIIIQEHPYQFVLNNISRDHSAGDINFQCRGSKIYYNDALKYDLSEQDREYAIHEFCNILCLSILPQGPNVGFAKTPSYTWPLPSKDEYEAKGSNIGDMIITQVVPQIKELHELFRDEVNEKDRQIKELMNEFHLFYKWSKEEVPTPEFKPEIANMIGSHKLYPSIKHVKEVWSENH